MGVRNRRPKLRYAHQGGSNPPVIVIHGNMANELPEDYKRYLANTYRRVLEISGTPIRMEFRQGDNPFAEKQKDVRHSSKKRAEAVERTSTSVRSSRKKRANSCVKQVKNKQS